MPDNLQYPSKEILSLEFLDQFFDFSAGLFPDHVAIEQGNIFYTYRQVKDKAEYFSSYFIEKGIGPGEKVAILLPRSANVYIIMLAALKAGGAYIPIDPETPGDRIAFILRDSDAKMIVTCDELADRINGQTLSCHILNIDRWSNDQFLLNNNVSRQQKRKSSDLCYIIYTSGSSGTPKGVLLEHRNAVNYIKGALQIYPVSNTDRVLQGFSTAFDASVEEIWMAFSTGATLITGTFDIMRSGDRFSSILNQLRITFLSCAPTLLSMVREDIPSLRVLIFGGEVCPADLARRWCKKGRIVYNTYGPTETAVIATYEVINPDKPVTIGSPLPGYDVYIVNEGLEPVGQGEEGEILIGGESVARGYIHRDDLTARKFVETDRFTGIKKRYYRTGDLARSSSDGKLIFTGRADAQVKVRGFRVELPEIEELLVKFNGVQAAAVKLDEKTSQLAAYVVMEAGVLPDRETIARLLRLRLPYYMVPSTLDVIDELPLTTSQKIDRKRLPEPVILLSFSKDKERIAPVSPVECQIVEVMARHFGRDDISMNDHFFNDLGGHSLLAATIVSDLRTRKTFEDMSVADVYKHPLLSDLSAYIENSAKEDKKAPEQKHEVFFPSSLRYYTCCFFQGLAMIFLALLFGMEWLGPFFIYSYYYQADNGIIDSLFPMLWMYFAILPVLSVFAIGFKWIVIGRVKPGRHKMWGAYYFRFWLVDKVINICPVSYFAGTSIMNVFLRLLGAKVGKDSYINTSAITIFDLLKIGDNVSICTDTHLRGYTIADGYLQIGAVELEDDCFVGTRCCLSPDIKMGKNSSLEDLTLVPSGTVIPSGEHWGGSPAAVIDTNAPQMHRKKLWSVRNSILFFVSIFVIPLITMLAYFPGLMLITHLDYVADSYHFLWSTLGIGVSFVLLLTLIIAALKWLLLGNIKEGIYPVNSLFYYKKWFFDQLMKLSLEVIGTLYTTLYLQKWFKLLGVKMGKRVEISTVEFISPDLLETGDECFLADSVSVGASHVRNGYITIAKARIGNRTFVGNSAVISPGTRLGNDVLVGVLSKMQKDHLPAPDGTSWFGSPAVFLPRRDVNCEFSAERTYKPTPRLFALRYCIEFFRVVLPSTLFIVSAALIVDIVSYLQVEKSLGELFLIFPFLYLAAGVLATLITALLKWVLIGKYKPARKPLWSGYVWRSELVTGIYENFLVLFFLNLLVGTPFIKYPLRLLGCKIGSRTCLFTTQITEFDLIHIGKNCTANDNCTLQTHLFEDRVMKMSYINIADGCSIGGMSVVLYDSKIEDGSILEPLSVLMKGETLPAHTTFIGAPAKVRK